MEKQKTYEYYKIIAQKPADFSDPYFEPKWEVVTFNVRGTSHIQHHPGSTTIQGVTKSAQMKIDQYRKNGYYIYTYVGGHMVTLNN